MAASRHRRAVEAEIDGEPLEAILNWEERIQKLLYGGLQPELQHFGKAEQVPKREYTLKDLQDSGIEAARLLSPQDDTVRGIRLAFTAALAFGGAAVILAYQLPPFLVAQVAVAGMAALLVDQVFFRGAVDTVVTDSVARLVSEEYRSRVVLHEAGHFLVAYLVGVLPKAYTLSAWDAFTRYQSPSLQAGTVFCDASFQQETKTGKLSSDSLDQFVCVAVAGVAVEFLLYGQAKGGTADVQQLDNLFRALGFGQRQASAQLRWAVLNVVGLLRKHAKVHEKLAETMKRNAPVGECIALLERLL